MKSGFLLIFIFLNQSALAMPQHFEVWFLSTESTVWLDTILNKNKKNYQKISQSRLQCQPMGDYCFDPQVGLYKKGKDPYADNRLDSSIVEKKETYNFVPPAESVDRKMIECENANFFDVFCGETKSQSKNVDVKLEVWIDTSSTMKQADFKGFNKKCSRELFLDRLSQTCPLNQKMKVYYFEESRKEAGAFDRVCLSSGLNDMKKLMKDVRRSKVKNLIIMTDIFEAHEEFIKSIEDTGVGIIKGLDQPIYASQINDNLQRIRKMCL